MRSILTFGGLVLACSLLGVPARAAGDDTGDGNLISAPEDGSLLSGSCDCEFECFDCCDCYNGRRRVLGMLPSDHCFDRFISPLSNPFFFEDPRSLTEVRGIFIENSVPNFIDGGNAQVFAAQVRGRVTDRVSIIAPRLGHLQVNEPNGGPNGLMSAPVGAKYNFIRDVERQFLVSAGITYFIKGAGDFVWSIGDGDFNFFLTGGKEIFDYGHWLSATGFRIPLDNNWGTQMWYWSNQWDYELPNHIYPLAGINWFHFMSSAGVPTGLSYTSLDLINLPANGVAGTNVVSGLVGVKYKPNSHLELGSGFEFPLTDRNDVLKNRLYVDAILRY